MQAWADEREDQTPRIYNLGVVYNEVYSSPSTIEGFYKVCRPYSRFPHQVADPAAVCRGSHSPELTKVHYLP